MSLDPQLLEIIRCPACRSEFDAPTAPGGTVDGAAGPELVCRGCGLAYPVRDDIPVLLVDEARRP